MRAGMPEPKGSANIIGLASPEVETSTMSAVGRRFIPFLLAAYIVSYMDRVNVGFAALTANRDLGLTPTLYGWGAGIFFIGYFIFEYPSNLILERVGARLWIARIMITWGLISGAMAFVVGPVSFVIARFLLGVAEAGFFPGIILFMTYWFPRRRRARYIGLFMLGIPLASLIGGPISGALLEMDGVMGLKGWQWLYIVEAVPSVVLGFVAWFALTDRPALATWLSSEQRTWLEQTLAKENATQGRQGKHGFFATLADPRVLSCSAIFFAVSAPSYGLSLWLPQIVQGFGLSNVATGFITAIPFAFGTAAMALWARHSDRDGERVWHTAACAFCMALGLGACILTDVLWLQMVGICVAALGIFGIKGPWIALVTELLAGASAAGSIAMVSAIGNLSGFLPPYIVGWIRAETGSFSLGLLFLAVLAASGGMHVLLFARAERTRVGAAMAVEGSA